MTSSRSPMMAATGKPDGLLGMGEGRDASSGTRTVELFKLVGYNFYNILLFPMRISLQRPRGLRRAPPGDCAGAAPPTGAAGVGGNGVTAQARAARSAGGSSAV